MIAILLGAREYDDGSSAGIAVDAWAADRFRDLATAESGRAVEGEG